MNNNKCPVLSNKEIREILFLSKQGGGRSRLICNLYKLSNNDLYNLLNIYN